MNVINDLSTFEPPLLEVLHTYMYVYHTSRKLKILYVQDYHGRHPGFLKRLNVSGLATVPISYHLICIVLKVVTYMSNMSRINIKHCSSFRKSVNV